MSTQDPAPRKPSVRRLWIPAAIVLLFVGANVVAWRLMPEDFARIWRVSITQVSTMAVVLLLALWFFLLSGIRPKVRLAALVLLIAVAGASAGAIRRMHFTGDVVPYFEYRWSPSQDDLLDQFQASKSAAKADASIAAAPDDWPQYRGKDRDGVVHGPKIAPDWKTSQPKQLWKRPVGAGYASCSIVGDYLVTIEQRRGDEVVVCYDARDGAERWTHRYPALFDEQMGGPGPRATPTIVDGEVYSLGATGVLCRLDLATGKPAWSVNILEKNKSKNLEWAMSASPLVDDERVVVSPGSQGGSADSRLLLAFHRKDGASAWAQGEGQAGYSSPMFGEFDGAKQILLFTGDSMRGFDGKSGKQLWTTPFPVMNNITVAQPIVRPESRIFLTAGYGGGASMLQLQKDKDAWTPKVLWHEQSLRCRFTSPVYYDGHFYGSDEGILVCISEKTGERKWKGGRVGNGELLLIEDRLLVLTESGDLLLAQASPTGFKELGRFHALDGPKTWNVPAVARGIAYVRNHLEMAAFDLRPAKPSP
jgi:outer membrane protein assembly factor BamB